MRVVIEGIQGKDLVILMYLLERMEFANKQDIMAAWQQYLEPKKQ